MQKREMMRKGLCFKCGKKGHKEDECPEAEKKPNVQATQQVGEENPMAWQCALHTIEMNPVRRSVLVGLTNGDSEWIAWLLEIH